MTPICDHWSRMLSISIILVWARYITGFNPVVADSFIRAIIGDAFCLPAANQFSGSAIQNSGSSCIAIICVSVNIMLFLVVACLPCASKY